MTTKTFYHSTVLVFMECGACGVAFGLNEKHYNAALADHSVGWWCPGCGRQRVFIGETEEDRLRKQAQNLRDDLAWWRAETAKAARSASAFKGQATKLRRRAKNGVCPVCTRTFANYAAHMHKEHPDFEVDA